MMPGGMPGNGRDARRRHDARWSQVWAACLECQNAWANDMGGMPGGMPEECQVIWAWAAVCQECLEPDMGGMPGGMMPGGMPGMPGPMDKVECRWNDARRNAR